MWESETETAAGRIWLLPGPWAKGRERIQINPSYILPFVYRDFALADRTHDWLALLDDGYRTLADCRGLSGLPKDWCWVDRQTGEVLPPEIGRAHV